MKTLSRSPKASSETPTFIAPLQQEFDEQVSAFFRRETSVAAGKAKLLAYGSSLLPQLTQLGGERAMSVYVALAFWGRVDFKQGCRLPSLDDPAAFFAAIRERKLLRVASSGIPVWRIMEAAHPEMLAIAVQLIRGNQTPQENDESDSITTEHDDHEPQD